MRLIDADALIAQMEADAEHIEEPIAKMFAYAAINDVKHAPTIEERKTGEWIYAEWENINTGEIRKGRRCSACGCGYFRYDVSVNTVSDIPNFCPNCGADMRGEQHEVD